MTTIEPTRSPRAASAVFWTLISIVRWMSFPATAGFSAISAPMLPDGVTVASRAPRSPASRSFISPSMPPSPTRSPGRYPFGASSSNSSSVTSRR